MNFSTAFFFFYIKFISSIAAIGTDEANEAVETDKTKEADETEKIDETKTAADADETKTAANAREARIAKELTTRLTANVAKISLIKRSITRLCSKMKS